VFRSNGFSIANRFQYSDSNQFNIRFPRLNDFNMIYGNKVNKNIKEMTSLLNKVIQAIDTNHNLFFRHEKDINLFLEIVGKNIPHMSKECTNMYKVRNLGPVVHSEEKR
jgi:hypothetical protein